MTRLSPTEDLLASVKSHLDALEGGMVPRTEGDDIADLHLAVADLHLAVARINGQLQAVLDAVKIALAREVL